MAKSMKQQAAIAIAKKNGMKRGGSGRKGASKSVGKMFKKHNMDHNRDGKIDARDFAIMRKQQKKAGRRRH